MRSQNETKSGVRQELHQCLYGLGNNSIHYHINCNELPILWINYKEKAGKNSSDPSLHSLLLLLLLLSSLCPVVLASVH